MSSSTGQRVARIIKNTTLFRKEPSTELLDQAEKYLDRAEEVVIGNVSNTGYALKKTVRNWIFTREFLQGLRRGKE